MSLVLGQPSLANQMGHNAAAIPGWYRWVAYGSLTVAAGTLATIAVAHLAYPGFAEAMEGDLLQHIERAARGQPVYPRPQAEYIPLTYMPLYYYLAAPFYLLFGDSFFGPRLLSVLATLGSAFWIGRITLRETGSGPAAALGAAFFCGSFRVMDAALFTVHPDALLLFWVLTGYWFWAYGTSRRDDVIWLLCFTCAFWTKQSGALFFGWAVLYAMFFRHNALPRWAILLGIGLGGPVAYTLIGSFCSERLWFHTFIAPNCWEQSWWLALRRTIYVLCILAPITSVVFVDFWRKTRQAGSWKPTPLVWFIVASLLTCLYTMRISGTSNNHYAALHALLAVTLAVMCHRLFMRRDTARLLILMTLMAVASCLMIVIAKRHFPQHDVPAFVPVVVALASVALLLVRRAPAEARPRWQATILISAQFAVMAFDPLSYLPSPGWPEAVKRFGSELAQLDGPVIWVDYGNIPADLTGTKIARAPSWVALEDVDRQQVQQSEIEANLQPWREHVQGRPNLYLLSAANTLKHVPVWSRFADNFELVRDYGDTFAAVRQVAEHWYVSGGPPRFLFRKKQPGTR